MPFKNKFEIRDDYAVIFLNNKKLGVFECYVDIEDLEVLKKYDRGWHVQYSRTTKTHYAQVSEYLGIIDGKPKSKSVLMHRLLTNCEKGMTVDHLNYNTLDNRQRNMRVVTLLENNKNKENRPNRNTSTGVRNVCWSNRESKYVVQFQINGKNTRMGKFDNLEDAKKYADENRHKYYTNV